MYSSHWYTDGEVFDIEPLYPTAMQADDLNKLLLAGASVAFYNNGSIIAVAGIIPAWTGIANVVMRVGRDFPRCCIKVVKELKTLLAIYAYTNDTRKYYAMVEKPFVGWIKLLDFTYEYTMVEASPLKEDLFGYCLITEG